jgi:hypothetical protein
VRENCPAKSFWQENLPNFRWTVAPKQIAVANMCTSMIDAPVEIGVWSLANWVPAFGLARLKGDKSVGVVLGT